MDTKSNPEAWFMSSFIEQVIPAEGALWSCFFVSSIDNGMKHPVKANLLINNTLHYTQFCVIRDL